MKPLPRPIPDLESGEIKIPFLDSDDEYSYKNGKLPGYYKGKPTKVGEYNVYPSAIGAEELNVTTPEVVVTGTDRRPLYQRYDAERSVYDSNDIISGLNILTLGGMNNLSPTQWARRFYDTPKLFSGDMSFSDYTNKWLNGNDGIVSSEFAQKHPYYSMLFNTIGDGLIGASAVQSARVLNQLRPQNLGKHFYYNVNPQGYDNIIKQAKGIAKTVLKGSEPDIENPIWDTPGAFKAAASGYSVPEDVFFYRLRDGSSAWGGNEKVRFQQTNMCDVIMFDGNLFYNYRDLSRCGK